MRITFACLKEFLDFSLSCQQIAENLTCLGIEVDKIENEKPSFQGVVTVLVEECQKHPSADKLSIAKVTDGKDTFQVVCGAANCRRGLKTALAKVGAILDNGKKKIDKAKLRDVESFGMLTSAKELNLFEESGKILEFDDDTPLGKDVGSLVDPVFEISLTPNLGHLLSGLGIARELGAFLNKKVILPKISLKADKIKPKVEVEEKDLCPRYTCCVMERVKVKDSPFWLKYRLEACGIKSINLIVDITNYTMLMLGQPMHAFDYNLIHGKVRIAKTSSPLTFTGLDDVERKLEKPALFIQDEKGPIALAGILGFKNSAISINTQNILLESAYFLSSGIQSTSKLLDLKTQSSMRFEKGCDINMASYSLDFAANLLKKHFPEASLSEKEDIFTPHKSKEVTCRVKKANKLLGTTLSLGEIESIFQQLDFEIIFSKNEEIKVKIPSYRHDINIEVDLIEEVARIYGYNNIVKRPSLCRTSTIAHAPMYVFENKVKERLIGQGMQELISCDLISPTLAKMTEGLNLSKAALIEVLKTKSQDFSILRPTLFPSLLKVVKYNQDHGSNDIFGFELSRIHIKENGKYIEQAVLAMISSGKCHPHFWKLEDRAVDFFDLKGILENLFKVLFITDYEFKPSCYTAFHPKRQADIYIKEQKVGIIGQAGFNVTKVLDTKKEIFFAELNLNTLFKLHTKQNKVQDICPYPASQRDWTVKVKESMPFDRIMTAIKQIESHLLEEVFLLDIFKGDDESKNITLRFIYRDKEKTLLFDEAEKEHNRVIKEAFNLFSLEK